MKGASRPAEIADGVRREIVTGRYRPGERLPSERELADQAGVNRGSAREALKILAKERLIEVKPGGARVAPLHQANLDVLGHVLEMPGTPDPALVSQLLDVHEMLLVGAARLAVERASPAELERAGALLDELMKRGASEAAQFQTLASLLQLIAQASQNLVLHMVGNSLHAILAAVVPLLRRIRPTPRTLAPSIATLREAIDERNPEKAEAGVRALLRLKRETLMKELELEASADPATPRSKTAR
ncbi:MAG: GntR family transcriptional regulator [Myxococcales bacterium]|nr:GntR family transcriptional regulator [Myxococcales bacterium]